MALTGIRQFSGTHPFQNWHRVNGFPVVGAVGQIDIKIKMERKEGLVALRHKVGCEGEAQCTRLKG